MRDLNQMELNEVSGGDWSLTIDLKIVEFTISGDESIQDMAAGMYNGAMEAMVGALTWLDSFNNYESGCSGGGGR